MTTRVGCLAKNSNARGWEASGDLPPTEVVGCLLDALYADQTPGTPTASTAITFSAARA